MVTVEAVKMGFTHTISKSLASSSNLSNMLQENKKLIRRYINNLRCIHVLIIPKYGKLLFCWSVCFLGERTVLGLLKKQTPELKIFLEAGDSVEKYKSSRVTNLLPLHTWIWWAVGVCSQFSPFLVPVPCTGYQGCASGRRHHPGRCEQNTKSFLSYANC